MKKSLKNMKKETLLLIFSIFLSATVVAQRKKKEPDHFQSRTVQPSELYIEKTTKMKFEGNGQYEVLSFEIPEQTKDIDINVLIKTSSGKVYLEIYDSNGKKKYNTSAGTLGETSTTENSKLSMISTLKEPSPGTWKVILLLVNAKGTIEINTNFYIPK